MAKRKKSTNKKWEEEIPSTFDESFSDITAEAKKQFVGDVYAGGEEEREVFCIEVPALAVRFLLQQEGWPLQRFSMFIGPQESFKSTFAVEVIRWHRLQRGNGVQIRVEPKPAPEIQRSILKWDDLAMKIHKCMTLEEWHKALDFWVYQVQRVMDGYTQDGKKIKGKGRCFPVCYVVDSLMAGLDDALYAKMEQSGTACKHFSTQAGFMTDYMRYLPTKLVGYPFSFIGINHMKEKQDDNGHLVRSVPGGKSLLYHDSFEVELYRSKQISRVDEKGVTVRMVVTKNSGAPHENLSVDVLWYIDLEDKDPVTGHCRQKTWFDWDSASIEVLRQLQSTGDVNKTVSNRGGAKQAKLLKDLVELHIIEDKRKVWSPVLGISQKNAVSFPEAGAALEEKIRTDEEFKNALYPLCGIRRRNMFKPGEDFVAQQERVALLNLERQKDIESQMPIREPVVPLVSADEREEEEEETPASLPPSPETYKGSPFTAPLPDELPM